MKIKPKQLEFMDWEMGVFFHFGIRTYYEEVQDWDVVDMDPARFAPTELDCDQWISTAKAGGAKYAVLVCKHHDGFALWNSKFTAHSVAASPWKDGKGDVVREFTDACHRQGMKVGFYYSPAQFGFETVPEEEYDDYFIGQLGELLTGYGKVDYLWFDGCGSENHQFDTVRIVKEIRRMQPDILIFNMWDPDTRWIGNESGIASMNDAPEVDRLAFSIFTEREDKLGDTLFLPGECDCRIKDWWFYYDSDVPYLKSVEQLFGMYLNSVGHGTNLLLNIGPDRRGLIPEKDVERMTAFGDLVRREFGDPLVTFDRFRQEGDTYTADCDDHQLMKYIVIEEDLTDGSHVTDFDIDLLPTVYGQPKTVFRGYSVGHKAICPLHYLAGRGISFTVKGKKGPVKIKNITVYG